MEVTCPNCGEHITAENINIKEMAAVCPACHEVFNFEIRRPKVKRRKVKQPEHLILREADTLNMEFRTNFRLDKDETFVPFAILSMSFTAISLLTFGGFLEGEVPILIPFLFSLLALTMYYFVALRVLNKTHIDVEDEAIRVSRQPLRSPLSQAYEINLSGLAGFRADETQSSKNEGFDTPHYFVRAVMEDGTTKTVVNNVPDDYAHFIAQRLTEYLDLDTPQSHNLLAEKTERDESLSEIEDIQVEAPEGMHRQNSA